MKLFKEQVNILFFLFLISFVLASYKIIFSIKFVILPILFFLIGFVLYLLIEKKAVYLFLFLLPVINSTPDLFFNGYPYNYMAVSLFFLSGIIFACYMKKTELDFNYRFSKFYLLFLGILFLSVFFVFLRWSNVTLSTHSFFKNTPVDPTGIRLSFASVFPVVTLFLFYASPFIFIILKKQKIEESEAFKWITYGYFISLFIALVQRFYNNDFLSQKWWMEKAGQVNGGFSDFNSFGVFSGILFVYFTVKILQKLSLFNIAGLIASMAGIFLSGSRTAFIFMIISVFIILMSKKIKKRYKILALLVIIVLIIFAGGILKRRINRNINKLAQIWNQDNKIRYLDKLSNGRITMIENSMHIIKKFPVTGVGGGNFLFYLRYMKYGTEHLEDLPLNNYLHIIDEIGIIGFLFFFIFLIFIFKDRKNKDNKLFIILFLSFLFVLLFNNFLWFPEINILFWILISISNREKPGKIIENNGQKTVNYFIFAGLILIFIIMNIFNFNKLHPKELIKEKGGSYDYGFWYEEKNNKDKTFRWTKSEAGIYMFPYSSRTFSIKCGAPISHLRENKQIVNIYWKDKLFKKLVFRENRSVLFNINKSLSKEGFLELRIEPVFNLNKLNISTEKRNLGVKFFVEK